MFRKSHTVTAVAVAVASILSASAFAAAPTVQITEPTSANVVYSDTFPFVQPISFTLGATTRSQGGGEVDAQLKDLGVLDVQVDSVTIVNGGNPIGNPFTNTNACASILTTGGNSCTPSDAKNAAVSVPWQVGAPGQYTITVSAKIQSAEGEDQEVVLVELLNAEYPAPPAVANAYIKANPSVLASKKQHGCVISMIADEHAKYLTFGPKGGPYDNDLVASYVIAFASSCPIK